MSTLNELIDAIDGILQDPAYTRTIITKKINASLQIVAAGIMMPDGEKSPPLPDLYTSGTIPTVLLQPYASLPANYQRNLFNVYDESFNKVSHPRGGGYNSFSLFMSQITNLSLMEQGSVYIVCAKGTKLYYQGIPLASVLLGCHYYRKPTVLVLDGDIPEGIPEHLQERILKHHVCMNVFGEKIEDGQDNTAIGTKYHTSQFYGAMTEMVEFIGKDTSPMYYGSDDFVDLGACDG